MRNGHRDANHGEQPVYPLSIWTALKAPTGGFGIGLKSGGDVTSVTGVTGWADKVSDDSLGCRSTRIKQLARSGLYESAKIRNFRGRPRKSGLARNPRKC